MYRDQRHGMKPRGGTSELWLVPHTDQVLNTDSPLTRCVTLSNSFDLSGLWFPHLKNRWS